MKLATRSDAVPSELTPGVEGHFVKSLWTNSRLKDVQDVLFGSPAEQLLRSALMTMLAEAELLGRCRLLWAEFKAGRKLTAHYEVEIAGAVGAAKTLHSVVVVWRPPGADNAEALDRPRLEAIQAEAKARGLMFPWRQLQGELPGLGLTVQCWPLDSAFPQLLRVADPRHVYEMIQTARGVKQYPSRPEHMPRYAVKPVRYRPGERHVLRYDPCDTREDVQDPRTVFAKLYHSPEDAARSFRLACGISDRLSAIDNVLGALRPLGYVADDALVLYPLVKGTPLSAHIRRPGPALAQHLVQAGLLLGALHSQAEATPGARRSGSTSPNALCGELNRHRGFAREVKKISQRTCEHIQVLLPELGRRITRLLQRALELYERLPQEPWAFAHGDFKAEHLWLTSSGLTLIDFDTCYLADPAIDVGKFLADLRWWYAVCNQNGLEQAQAHFLDTYACNVPRERLARARLFEALVLVRLTAHRSRVSDADWAARTESLISSAESVVRDLET